MNYGTVKFFNERNSMLLYVIIFIGALWGTFTLIGINEEDKEIQEMVESARNAIRKSHGSE